MVGDVRFFILFCDTEDLGHLHHQVSQMPALFSVFFWKRFYETGEIKEQEPPSAPNSLALFMNFLAETHKGTPFIV